ncbi:MAG: dTDP-4-dehydrorhamnose 3,5-epimerase family protein [Leptothrix ochracea]|uniref:dTDP-4-dehydrorhamnose 3,5-epimerase family protein n=1 Tax=Leptothrix ochracea TaxID=735331 RepID=UPI0034E2D028
MDFTEELLPGAWLVKLRRIDDARGHFVKTYARSVFEQAGVVIEHAESFYSLSNRNVIRGMHFQVPPRDHAKLVYCPAGALLDVLLDLRPGPGFGRSARVVLSAEEPRLVLLPPGIAHGFRALQDGTVAVYHTSTEHSPAHDQGVRWDSFGMDWGLGDAPAIVSARDQAHPSLRDFASPF